MPKPLVLVVEDEAMIRLNAVMMLEDADFDTLEAGSADEAIVHLETNRRIQIVFTDIDMPKHGRVAARSGHSEPLAADRTSPDFRARSC